MTSVTPLNSAALLILQQGNEADILKIANGVSSEPSQGKKTATAVIGKFAVDSAPPASGAVVMGDLGAVNSWEELKDLVQNNAAFSDTEKKEWRAKIAEAQSVFEGFASLNFSVDEIKALAATRPMASSETAEDRDRKVQLLNSINSLLVADDREPISGRSYLRF